ncbi:MAG: metallophosphoesterase [Chloroflexota bacterium]
MTQTQQKLRIWAFGDAHVGTDLKHGRFSLIDAIQQTEVGTEHSPPFEWDFAIDIGDMSGGHEVPDDDEGAEVVRQLEALQFHARESIYSVCGNHDRSGLDEPDAWWWQKWVDPLGEFPQFSKVDSSKRPYPITGTWERYSFEVGNLLFLMMSDRNEPSQKIGRGTLGGNPGGVVSAETFTWWQEMIQANSDKIIVSVHHYMLKNTTVASGEWEGMRKDENGNWRTHYHGYYPEGTPQGASYLYWVGGQEDSGAFESYLANNPSAISVWLGGHTHTNPDDNYGNRTHIEQKWGTWFMNVGALTRWHVKRTVVPMSRRLTLIDGSNEILVECYLHTDQYAPVGWYKPAERRLTLSKPVQL